MWPLNPSPFWDEFGRYDDDSDITEDVIDMKNNCEI